MGTKAKIPIQIDSIIRTIPVYRGTKVCALTRYYCNYNNNFRDFFGHPVFSHTSAIVSNDVDNTI